MRCRKCEEKSGKPIIEPCAICRNWLEKFTGQPEITEAEKISQLVATNAALQSELTGLREQFDLQTKKAKIGK